MGAATTEWTLGRGGDGSRDLKVYVSSTQMPDSSHFITVCVRFADPSDEHAPATLKYRATRHHPEIAGSLFGQPFRHEDRTRSRGWDVISPMGGKVATAASIKQAREIAGSDALQRVTYWIDAPFESPLVLGTCDGCGLVTSHKPDCRYMADGPEAHRCPHCGIAGLGWADQTCGRKACVRLFNARLDRTSRGEVGAF